MVRSCGMRALLVVGAVVSTVVSAVDRSNFKTCDQSSFCKRHRALTPGDSAYSVVAETVRLDEARLEAQLESRSGGGRLRLGLTALTDSTFWLNVDELDGVRRRYRPLDALDGAPTEQKFKSHTPGSGSSMLLTADGNKVVLHYRPFRLDAYSGTQELVLSINSQGLFNFERFRTKPQDADGQPKADSVWRRAMRPLRSVATAVSAVLQSADAADDEAATSDEDVEPPADEPADDGRPSEEGMWEEHWKSHHDSKPHGASSFGADITFVGFEHVFGIPEHADTFALKSTASTDPYRLYNLDVFEYELNCPMALYGSVPFMTAVRAFCAAWSTGSRRRRRWRRLTLTGCPSRVSSTSSSCSVRRRETWRVSSRGSPASPLCRPYSSKRPSQPGSTPLQLFSIAYHQCRWNYKDMEDVRAVDAAFDEHDIPYDVIWLDIEHTDGKRYFTWDTQKFSNPKEMIDGIAAKHRKMVTIIDPHIKKDDGYKVYKEAKDNGYFVKNKDDSDYEGFCWPGSSMYLDFLNPVVRDYWVKHFRFDEYAGSTESLFVWNDMNDPSVFSGPEVTMPKDNKHFGGWEHRDVHNMYGFYHHMSTFRGLSERSAGALRPFLLTRSFFAGSQRGGAVWTGDNAAEWSHLQISLPMLLSISVAGVPFVGADVGGFFKNPDEELLVRWYQAGAFYPFFRAHAHIDTRRREPWLFTEATKLHIRDAIRLRYSLLPYWYTVFREHEVTGWPVMRPLWFDFSHDKFSMDEERQFMIGNALLVRPVTEAGAHSVSIYLPGEGSVWYDLDTFQARPGPGAVYVDSPLSKIPVFIRGGTIVPLWSRVRRASALMRNDPITLYVALNYDGDHANGSLYLDDGATYAHRQGAFVERLFEFVAEGPSFASLSSRNLNATGSLPTEIWVEKMVVMGLRFWPRDVHLYYDDYKPVVLKFAFERSTSTLTVRRPPAGVTVNRDWRIDIHG